MSTTPTAYLVDLHKSLDQRLRPEDVLSIIQRGCPEVPRTMNGPQRWAYWSSMSSDFARPVGGERQLASAQRAFQRPVPQVDPNGAAALRDAAEQLGSSLAWTVERSAHLTRAERKAAGVEVSRRAYNRQYRALRRIARKADKLETEQRKRELLIIGRSGFTTRITLDRFVADPAAAYFIAYWVARKNLRRQFTLDGKQNPMDHVAATFLARCEDEPSTDWAMIALVRPTSDVLARLTDEQKGELLGQWYVVMREAAVILKGAWSPDINRTAMVVRRGNDSSTWNTITQAYNTARASWLSCVAALGADVLLDAACPGKVMRLMAADLVRWHDVTGGSLEPNTAVWAALPFPWDVLNGDVVSTRGDVEAACRAAGLDPRNSGWIAPRPPGDVVSFSPTPELVHGVSIADPVWAGILRRAGVFSGQRLTEDPELLSTAAHGLAGGVVVSDLPSRERVE